MYVKLLKGMIDYNLLVLCIPVHGIVLIIQQTCSKYLQTFLTLQSFMQY